MCCNWTILTTFFVLLVGHASCLSHLTFFVGSNAERLKLIREQRAEAAKKREEEKAGKFLLKD